MERVTISDDIVERVTLGLSRVIIHRLSRVTVRVSLLRANFVAEQGYTYRN